MLPQPNSWSSVARCANGLTLLLFLLFLFHILLFFLFIHIPPSRQPTSTYCHFQLKTPSTFLYIQSFSHSHTGKSYSNLTFTPQLHRILSSLKYLMIFTFPSGFRRLVQLPIKVLSPHHANHMAILLTNSYLKL